MEFSGAGSIRKDHIFIGLEVSKLSGIVKCKYDFPQHQDLNLNNLRMSSNKPPPVRDVTTDGYKVNLNPEGDDPFRGQQPRSQHHSFSSFFGQEDKETKRRSGSGNIFGIKITISSLFSVKWSETLQCWWEPENPNCPSRDTSLYFHSSYEIILKNITMTDSYLHDYILNKDDTIYTTFFSSLSVSEGRSCSSEVWEPVSSMSWKII